MNFIRKSSIQPCILGKWIFFTLVRAVVAPSVPSAVALNGFSVMSSRTFIGEKVRQYNNITRKKAIYILAQTHAWLTNENGS